MPVWQVFVLSQDNVKNKGYVTLFQYMTKNKKSLFARVVMSAPEVLQVSVLYLCLSCFALVLYYVVLVPFSLLTNQPLLCDAAGCCNHSSLVNSCVICWPQLCMSMEVQQFLCPSICQVLAIHKPTGGVAQTDSLTVHALHQLPSV